jgi:hypothetical protein
MGSFAPATKKKAKLRLTFDGPAGSGKTYSSLLLAKTFGGRVALIDSEFGSASKYAGDFQFDAVDLDDFSPESYRKLIEEAGRSGYDALIIDSLSHAWMGKGGALELVDRLGQGDKFGKGWRSVTPMHNALLDAIVAAPLHVICTMRTKMEHVIEDGPNGKKQVRKVGMAPIQRDGTEYLFDVVVDLDVSGDMTVSKSRCSALAGTKGLLKLSDVERMGETLKTWLSGGTDGAAANGWAGSGRQSEEPRKAAPTSAPAAPAPVQTPPPAAPPASGDLLARIAAANTKAELQLLGRSVLGVKDPAAAKPLREAYAKRQAEVA